MIKLTPYKLEKHYFITNATNNESVDAELVAEPVEQLPNTFQIDKGYIAVLHYSFKNAITDEHSFSMVVTTYMSNLNIAGAYDGSIGTVNVGSSFAIANKDESIVARSNCEPYPVYVSNHTSALEILDITDQWAYEALINHVESLDAKEANDEAIVEAEANKQDSLANNEEFSTQTDVE
jgi:hypothetical protein